MAIALSPLADRQILLAWHKFRPPEELYQHSLLENEMTGGYIIVVSMESASFTIYFVDERPITGKYVFHPFKITIALRVSWPAMPAFMAAELVTAALEDVVTLAAYVISTEAVSDKRPVQRRVGARASSAVPCVAAKVCGT